MIAKIEETIEKIEKSISKAEKNIEKLLTRLAVNRGNDYIIDFCLQLIKSEEKIIKSLIKTKKIIQMSGGCHESNK